MALVKGLQEYFIDQYSHPYMLPLLQGHLAHAFGQEGCLGHSAYTHNGQFYNPNEGLDMVVMYFVAQL